MKKRFTLIFLIIIFNINLYSVNKIGGVAWYNEYKNLKDFDSVRYCTQVIINENAYIYLSPNESAKKSKVDVGTKILIDAYVKEESLRYTQEENGYSAPWYISTVNNETVYVRGNDISNCWAEGDIDLDGTDEIVAFTHYKDPNTHFSNLFIIDNGRINKNTGISVPVVKEMISWNVNVLNIQSDTESFSCIILMAYGSGNYDYSRVKYNVLVFNKDNDSFEEKISMFNEVPWDTYGDSLTLYALYNNIKYKFNDSYPNLIYSIIDVDNKSPDGEIIFKLGNDSKQLNIQNRLIEKTYSELEINQLMNVAENLRLRKEETTSSNIITTLKKNSPVKIIQIGKEEIIDGIKSNWVKVEVQKGAKDRNGKSIHAGTVGWVFGGYLE